MQEKKGQGRKAAKRGMGWGGRGKGGWRRGREMENVRENRELCRKKTKKVNTAQPLGARGDERGKKGS